MQASKRPLCRQNSQDTVLGGLGARILTSKNEVGVLIASDPKGPLSVLQDLGFRNQCPACTPPVGRTPVRKV